mgnify:CR=1 FL=1
MANKRIIELNERTSINLGDFLMVDDATGSRKLSMSTLFNYLTFTSLIFVDTLPTTDIEPNVIYLVPHSGSTTQWDEYIYIDNQWNLIGTSTIDLTSIYQTNDKAAIQNNDIPWYGTSSTAAGTSAKVATTAAGNLGALAAGQKVSIKFTNANTASAPTLNVDGKGAHAIKAYGTTAPIVWWKAGDVVTFTYDGTKWIMGATQGEIEQINSDLTDKVDKVTQISVATGNGTKTYAQVVNELISGHLISSIAHANAYIDFYVPSSGNHTILRYTGGRSNVGTFSYTNGAAAYTINVISNGSQFYATDNLTTTALSDISSSVFPNEQQLILYA